MGHVRVKVRIAHPNRRNQPIEVVDALVDTGASFTTVPRPLANQLGLEVLGKHRTRTANGTIEIDRSFAYIEYDGRDEVMPVWISDSYPGVLIGVFTLEALGLAVDPKNGRLVDSELLLL
jgi:aspartyl protease family protein